MQQARRFAFAMAMFWATSLAPDAQAQGHRDRGDRWEMLGCADIGRRPERDIITVGRREGRFTAIRLEVSGNDVHVEDLRVIYSNGQPDDLRVRSEFREGSRSRPIDLNGRERSIDRIEIVSARNFAGRGRGHARICVSGLADNGPRRQHGGRWEPLGCQQVSFQRDRDIIRVGRREGRFRAIRLEVSGNDVHFDALTVVYANGQPDHLQVRSLIRQNTQTAPIDLRGDARSIERIEMVYRAMPNLRGAARVCVSGLE